jgi:hypothetical protein
MNEETDFSLIKKTYLKLSPDFKTKYRGRFTQIIGELSVFNELMKNGFDVEPKSGQGSYDIKEKSSEKRIEVKACNLSNPWANRGNDLIGGCSGIKPDKFDILVYVAFDDELKKIEHYIFTNEEAQGFPKARTEKRWYADKSPPNTLVLNYPFKSENFKEMTSKKADCLNKLIKDSHNKWNKIKKMKSTEKR